MKDLPKRFTDLEREIVGGGFRGRKRAERRLERLFMMGRVRVVVFSEMFGFGVMV